jgi:predicted PurR-regulated permease PerM
MPTEPNLEAVPTTDAEPRQPDPALPDPADTTPVTDRLPMNLPINVRSVSLAVLAVLGSIYTLHWASAVFIPLLLGVVASYALAPIVNRLERWHLPRAAGAGLVILALVAGTGWMGYVLADDAVALIETLPSAAQKLRDAVRPARGTRPGPIDQVQRAASELQQAAEETGTVKPPAAPRGVTRVQVEKPRFDIMDMVVGGTLGLFGLLGQTAVVVFISFFLLASGDSFRRKMVKIAGPTFTKKRITVQLLDEIHAQIQRYLMVQILTSALVGVATWLAMTWIGVESAAVWGLVAFVLNFVPYVGSVFTAGGLALVGFLQFGTIGMAMLVGGVSLFINTIEGNLLTPWLTSRASSMSPVVIFVGVLAFGWLWGIWGLLLGPPILMAIKAVCDRVEDLKPIGELLGG